jgi:hypothetical protein
MFAATGSHTHVVLVTQYSIANAIEDLPEGVARAELDLPIAANEGAAREVSTAAAVCETGLVHEAMRREDRVEDLNAEAPKFNSVHGNNACS